MRQGRNTFDFGGGTQMPPPSHNDQRTEEVVTALSDGISGETLAILRHPVRELPFLCNRQSAAADEYHLVAATISKVLRASSAVLEDEALAVATAVETLLRTYFASQGAPPSAFIASIEQAVEYLSKWAGPADIRDRIMNAVEQMKLERRSQF